MEHRIQLSTALLIAVKAGKRKQNQPKVAGIKISAKPATIQQKSEHVVDAMGNIISAAQKAFTA